MLGREHTTFELVRLEAVHAHQFAGMGDHLVGGDLAALTRFGIWITVEQIAGKGDFFAQRPAQKITSPNPKALTRQIQTGKLECRMKLQAVVVERPDWVHQLPAQLLELQGVMPDKVGF